MLEKINNNFSVNTTYRLIDSYEEIKETGWNNCPKCQSQPKVWSFDNGKFAACKCGENKYKHFSVQAESIMSYAKRNNGSLKNYDLDNLRKKWNEYCKHGFTYSLEKKM